MGVERPVRSETGAVGNEVVPVRGKWGFDK